MTEAAETTGLTRSPLKRGGTVFIPCKSDAEFFANLLVGNAYDKPVTS